MAIERNLELEQEIQDAVRSNDVDFFIRFIVDNNPEEVKANLIHDGYALPSGPTVSDIYEVVKVIEANEGQERVGQILSVAYLDTGASWTLGARNYIKNYGQSGDMLLGGETTEGDEGNFWSRLGSSLGALGSGLVSGFFGGITSRPNQTPAPQPEEERILGLKKETFWLVLGLSVVVITGAILLSRRRSTRI